MHLATLTLKGFKSFPDRTRLDFGPGVSVVVGPNGSGKSNVTDAVLWAMGEQSPSVVRGQSMQDVIFGGAGGVPARSAAEVEIVLDNADGAVALPFSEISIVRRLDRAGEGEYRLNGARVRLADVLEVLSDTGLGKESHSVISQGRVEAIVMSRPRDRRLLIEEAAGLGKHRRRRRSAQLKLQRTQENLARALDVEREARLRLRPLKRQAEAAELHQRLRLQTLQARLQLLLDAAAGKSGQLRQAEQQARAARQELGLTEKRLQEVASARARAERALASRSSEREALSRLLYRARTAQQRIQLRSEQVKVSIDRLRSRIQSAEVELSGLSEAPETSVPERQQESRIQQLTLELAQLEGEQEQALERELEELRGECEQAALASAQARLLAEQAGAQRREIDAEAAAAEAQCREAELQAEIARRNAAEVGAELAAANQFLRAHSSAFSWRGAAGSAERARPSGGPPALATSGEVHSLGELIEVEEGCELAVAAVLGARFEAAIVGDVEQALELLDARRAEGGSVLISGEDLPAQPTDEHRAAVAPCEGAKLLIELIDAPAPALSMLRFLLADAWLVGHFDDLVEGFGGLAVTQEGRVYWPARREMRQVARGGAEALLEKRNERERLLRATGQAAQRERDAKALAAERLRLLAEVRARRDVADRLLRERQQTLADRLEQERRLSVLLQKRRLAPEEGPLAVKRAQLTGELAAEERAMERLQRERAAKAGLIAHLQAQLAEDRGSLPFAERLLEAMMEVDVAGQEAAQRISDVLEDDRQAGEQLASGLQRCAREEAEIQAQLRARSEAVTAAEVAAQRLRDQMQDAQLELQQIAAELQTDLPPLQQVEPLSEEASQSLHSRLQRLTRERERLGPVNPLAGDEYQQALAHVQELECRRGDLETAIRELRTIIRDTDRQMKQTFEETFAAACENFEQLAGDVFPGGSGRLKLVAEGERDGSAARERDAWDREGGQVQDEGLGHRSGGTEDEGGAQEQAHGLEHRPASAEDGDAAEEDQDIQGVEIEITPAGKATKRLSLLSGGEKSMTALAFLFAVFLARPCPFYILDEVEAALDDLNLERFLALLRRYAERAQFIVITHQKRTMEAADWLYGVSMGADGISKVISRRLPPAEGGEQGAQLEPAVGRQAA